MFASTNCGPSNGRDHQLTPVPDNAPRRPQDRGNRLDGFGFDGGADLDDGGVVAVDWIWGGALGGA